jgi:hypothetical protein
VETKRSNDQSTIDLKDNETSGGLGRCKDYSRGKKFLKEDLKHEASIVNLQESLKDMIFANDSSSEKEGEI